MKALGGTTDEILSNMKVVVSFAREEKELSRFKKAATIVMNTSRKAEQKMGLSIGATKLLSYVIYGIGFFIGGLYIKEEVYNIYHKRSYDVASCIAVFMAITKCMLCTLGIMPNLNAVITAKTKAIPIFEVL